MPALEHATSAAEAQRGLPDTLNQIVATDPDAGGTYFERSINGCVAKFRSRLQPSIIQIANRGSGVLLLSLASGVLVKVA
jgi:hypothetical protein